MLEYKVNSPEAVFFRYAHSCTESRLNRGEITRVQYDEIERLRAAKQAPSIALLQEVYPEAVGEIKKLGARDGRNPWSVEVIRDYFLREHNMIIERGEGGYSKGLPQANELCKGKVGEVFGTGERGGVIKYWVRYKGKEETCVGNDLPGIKIGDVISIHNGFAGEKLTREELKKYGT